MYLLKFAATHNYFDIVVYLTKYGINVNRRLGTGDKFLNIAIRNGCIKTYMYLIKNGVILDVADRFIVFDLAIKYKSYLLIKYLIKAGYPFDLSNVYAAINVNDVTSLNILLDHSRRPQFITEAIKYSINAHEHDCLLSTLDRKDTIVDWNTCLELIFKTGNEVISLKVLDRCPRNAIQYRHLYRAVESYMPQVVKYIAYMRPDLIKFELYTLTMTKGYPHITQILKDTQH
jgi:hypothetical protein